MFLACSLTLDFASTIEKLEELATVERARTNCAGRAAAFEAEGTRILAAGRDMLATTTEGATAASKEQHNSCA